MFDESLLDDPEALTRADTRGLLRGAAEAGARVRTGLRLAGEAGLDALRPSGRPRALLVAGPGPEAGRVADLLGALTNGAVPVEPLRTTGALADRAALRWSLPGWAGSVDLLLLVTPDGSEPGLAALVDQAARRGCSIVAVAPQGSELAEALGSRGLTVPPAPEPYGSGGQERAAGAPGTFWALLTPLLVLVDRLGPAQSAPAPSTLAARLDSVAERCGPAVPPYGNPAKTLAAELAGALPLLWSEGALAGAAGRHAGVLLAASAGRPALAAELPEAMTAHGALLTGAFAGGSDLDDFFRDRVEEPEQQRARVVLLREAAPAAGSATVAAHDLVHEQGTPLSELEASEGSNPLEAAAELIATLGFTAAYLTIADTEAPGA
ncbi:MULTISPECIES: SIS domain-containing protein [Streptomyces]|uniref:Bifunctional glucose-6-phosphate/mannose-6-phosphate isomerase n=2 Tax=Streptomyces cacaoi TaxID=1898 RepID=A0A4Y3R2Q6_STRCI|nr:MULTISPECIES: SIS domain-containing protein [Streptomyces]QHF93178.1 mannose-6-phosphate isomerase [Streptomyces sp. NHF165]GEB51871.1 bifunctional glucose-6-phosphate/mannose-6-phosphate isomerase [Streptomyces cacaoi]